MPNTGLLPVGSTELYYESRGSGRAVLFIHAGVADGRMWDSQFDEIVGYRLIRFDMRGFGRSGVGSEPFADHRDVLAVLDHLEVDNAILVGCSIGANTALQVVNEAPERVSGLVLVGGDAPGFDPGIDYQSPEWPEAVAVFNQGDFRRATELDAEIWLAGRGRSTADLQPELVQKFLEMDLIALGNEQQRDELDVGEALDRLPVVHMPVLVVVGDRDLPQLVAAAEHLAGSFGERPATTIFDSAHLPSLDSPTEFNDALQAFLRSL